MRTAFLYILLSCSIVSIRAQEIDCTVNVSAQRMEGTDKQVYETLQTAIYEFMNNRTWSGYKVKIEERIECTMLVTITERTTSEDFKGTLNVVLRRPVYNSAYNTVLLNYIDRDFKFKYVEYEPLNYSDGVWSSNLTSMLAYYTYMALGFYFDSFSLFGGTTFFEKAQEIVNLAQSTQESGWKAFESNKNRYWIVANVLNPANSLIREFSYKYHRLGMDQMYERVDLGRSRVTESLSLLQKLSNDKPGLYILQLTLDAKKDEFVSIYANSRVPPMEKTNIVNILKEIDPANTSKYQAILEAK